MKICRFRTQPREPAKYHSHEEQDKSEPAHVDGIIAKPVANMAVGVTEPVKKRTTEAVNEPTTRSKPVLGKIVKPETEKALEETAERTSHEDPKETA